MRFEANGELTALLSRKGINQIAQTIALKMGDLMRDDEVVFLVDARLPRGFILFPIQIFLFLS